MEIPNWQVWAGLGIILIAFVLIVIFAIRLYKLPTRKKISDELKQVYEAKLEDINNTNLQLQNRIRLLEEENSRYKDNKFLSKTAKKPQPQMEDLDF